MTEAKSEDSLIREALLSIASKLSSIERLMSRYNDTIGDLRDKHNIVVDTNMELRGVMTILYEYLLGAMELQLLKDFIDKVPDLLNFIVQMTGEVRDTYVRKGDGLEDMKRHGIKLEMLMDDLKTKTLINNNDDISTKLYNELEKINIKLDAIMES